MNHIFKIRAGKYLKHLNVDITIGKNNTHYFITSPYDLDLLDEFRAMKGGRWQPDHDPPAWMFPICERNDYAIRFLEGYRVERYCNSSVETPEISDTLFKRPLFQAQKEAVSFALHKRGCFLAYEMGLGKTLIAIELMERATALYDSYIWWLVAPFGAQKSWARELIKWNAQIKPVVTTTYESLHKWMDDLGDEHIPHGVIFDESIKIKNPNAQRSQHAAELTRLIRAQHKNYFISLLSGAPAPKEPTDWWHQIECIFPGFLREGDLYKFRNRLANIIRVDHGYGEHPEIQSWREDEVASLGKRLQPIVLTKKKSDVLDLPKKIYDVIKCPPSKEIIQATRFIIETAESGIKALESLRELSDGFQYRKISQRIMGISERYKCSKQESLGTSVERQSNFTWIGSPKLDIINDLLDFYSKENGGPGRLVIYAAFHATIDKLMEHIQSTQKTKFKTGEEKPSTSKWFPIRIDGRGWSKSNALEIFEQSASNIVLVANAQCIHGLNLQQTLALVYYSNSFSTDARIQSEDRRDRPGMDVSKGTRIVDLMHLETDRLILERLRENIKLQDITIKEIKRCLSG